MKFRRQRFQRGTLRKVARANKQWAWEYRYQDPITGNRKSMFLSTEKFPTQVAVERHLEAFVLKLNSDNPVWPFWSQPSTPFLIALSRKNVCLRSSSFVPVTESAVDGDLSYSTASSYLSVIKQVRLKWGEHPHHSDEAGPGPGMAEEDGCRTQDQRPRQGSHAPVV